jgi:hypothetical protein
MKVRTIHDNEIDYVISLLADQGVRKAGVGLPWLETFVAEVDGKMVGMFTIRIPYGEYKRPVLIHFLIVDGYRVSTYACQLVKTVINMCRSRGWRQLVIDSPKDERTDRFICRKFKVINSKIQGGRKAFLAEVI